MLTGLKFPQEDINGSTTFHSTFSLSKTQAYLKEPFYIPAASFSKFSVVLLLTSPHW
ncbi:unnamed protein product [Gulo gulo]|uniref:Uncharacterized protein n=1 Tax=Gulo gulo TaxID=48420 RepID=A0A9X9PTP9_GULGU|nr:unnamed protein product [Gulo gulo]